MNKRIGVICSYLKNLFRSKCCKNENRKTFCTSNNLAFVKCINCGAESFPWRVSSKTGKAFRESHPDQWELLKDSY